MNKIYLDEEKEDTKKIATPDALAEKFLKTRQILLSGEINKELAEKLNVSNLRFSGLFNFMQAKSKAAHYNLVEDILKDSPEHVEVYNEYLNEYRGKPSTMYNFYYFRGSYVVLANSIKNGYKYQ